MISSILAPIFVFAVVVIVHEGGHFLMAKWTGMKVIEFAVGFGPVIVSKKWGETLYSLRLIPLGGFNKIAGMDDQNKDDPRAFNQRPTWAKLLVIVGGALFNVLLALLIFISAFKIEGYNTFPNLPKVGTVLAGSSAEKQHLSPGDTILSIEGKAMVKWTDIGEALKEKGNRVVSMEIDHEGATRQVTIIPEVQPDGRAIMGITPYVEHHETTMTEAIAMGFGRAADLLHMMTAGLYDMVTGAGRAEVSGPIGIARMSGEVASYGVMPLFMFIALLSLNLGLLNILPVPLLDGGHLILILLEAILGRQLPEKALIYIQSVGIAILGAIFFYALFHDISALM